MPNPTSPAAIAWADPARHAAFDQWLKAQSAALGLDPSTLRPASADASFRRYFRIDGRDGSVVVMDAPPPQEDIARFVRIAGLLRDADLHAPEVLALDEAQGFALVADLGGTLYLDALREATPGQADTLMREALRALVRLQTTLDGSTLPPYDEALLRRELAIFPEWCVEREFGRRWTDAQRQQWDGVADLLVRNALAQPQVPVHRDWMPRNLMVSDPNPGILDFQDAVLGPISYDVASMLRDAFISWDEEREIDWAIRYWELARRASLPVDDDFGEFWRALEWTGLQRHLKVLGIFCRLKHRDGKPAYSADLPRFFAYATGVATRYRPLQPLIPLLEELTGPLTTAGYSLR